MSTAQKILLWVGIVIIMGMLVGIVYYSIEMDALFKERIKLLEEEIKVSEKIQEKLLKSISDLNIQLTESNALADEYAKRFQF